MSAVSEASVSQGVQVDVSRRSMPARSFPRLNGANALAISVLVLIAGMVTRPAPDPDRFWHLATGRWIFANKAIPTTDPFSWTAPGRSWVAHEWLTEAVWYGIHRVAGWPGLAILTATLVTAAFAIVWRSAVVLGANRFVASLLILLGAIATSHTWGVRPQMLTITLLAWMMSTFHRTWADQQTRRLWWIPVVMLPWCNAHGGYVFGLAVLFAFAAGVTADAVLGRVRLFAFRADATSAAHGLAKKAWVIFALTILATFVNPHGAAGLLYPFTYLGDNASTRYIVEWFAPKFGDSQYTPFFLLVAMLGIVGVRLWRTIPLYASFAIFGLTVLALQSVRNIPPFVIVALPWIARSIGSLPQLRSSPRPPNSTVSSASPVLASPGSEAVGFGAGVRDRNRQGSAMPLVGVGAILLTVSAIAAPGLTRSAIMRNDRTTFPVDAVNWMKQHPRPHVLNEYSWGGYLTWCAPDTPVAVDGRPDMYGDEFIDRHLSIWWTQPGWENKLDSDRYERVIGRHSAPLVAALRKSNKWSVSYEDDRAVILDRK